MVDVSSCNYNNSEHYWGSGQALSPSSDPRRTTTISFQLLRHNLLVVAISGADLWAFALKPAVTAVCIHENLLRLHANRSSNLHTGRLFADMDRLLLPCAVGTTVIHQLDLFLGLTLFMCRFTTGTHTTRSGRLLWFRICAALEKPPWCYTNKPLIHQNLKFCFYLTNIKKYKTICKKKIHKDIKCMHTEAIETWMGLYRN